MDGVCVQSGWRWSAKIFAAVVFAVVIFAAVIVPSFCLTVAADEIGTADEIEQPSQNSLRASKNRLMVLKNRRVIRGDIFFDDNGYLVRQQTGKLFIPYPQVLFLASSISDAHQKLRRSLPQRSIESSVKLVRWCLSNHLRTQAISELKEALLLEPSNVHLQRMLVRVENHQHESTGGSSSGSGSFSTTRTTSRTTALPSKNKSRSSTSRTTDRPAQSLTSLSRRTSATFLGKVQPILINHCATAGCHGTNSPTSFRLHRVRFGRAGQLKQIEQNLATILGHITPNDLRQSPLFVKSIGKHGQQKLPMFHGSRGRQQHQILREWIVTIAREMPRSSSVFSAGRLSAKTVPKEVAVAENIRRYFQKKTDQQPPKKTTHPPLVRRSSPHRLAPYRPAPLPPSYQLTPAMRAIRERMERQHIQTEMRRDHRPQQNSSKKTASPDAFSPDEFNRNRPNDKRDSSP